MLPPNSGSDTTSLSSNSEDSQQDATSSFQEVLIDEAWPQSLIPWRKFYFPIDWNTQFKNDNPNLHLEIGFGDGRYTVHRALRAPEDHFVGLEISSGSIQRAVKGIKRAGLDNVFVLKAAAEFAVQHLFTENSLESITVNFPDPWPKEKHEKNRLLQRSFYHLASTRLKPGGVIKLATDHPDYFEFACSEAIASGLYDLVDAEAPEAVFETKYALKWKEMGKPLFYKRFELKEKSQTEFPILQRGQEMPHSILKGTIPTEVPFEKQILEYSHGHVVLHEVSSSWSKQARGRLLIRSTINEPHLKQQLLILVKQRQDEEIVVSLASFGDPIITKTTRGAIHAATEWLLSLDQGLTVERRDY